MSGSSSSKVYVYYHVAQMGDWRDVVNQQLDLLQSSGLYDFMDQGYVTILGPDKFPDFRGKFALVHHSENLAEAELPTLDDLHKRAQREDFSVLYMHTKGVSWREQGKSHEAMMAWRKYMEYFCIVQWPECLAWLGTQHDAVGVQWTNRSERNGHFSGNFWWTTSRYIRTLSNIHDVTVHPGDPDRMKAEMWLGSNPDIRPKCLHTHPDNLYLKPIAPVDYEYA